MSNPFRSARSAFTIGRIIAVNAVPLFGVFFLGWSVFEVMFVFWAETLVIGLFHGLRIGTASIVQRDWFGLIIIPFFLWGYGLFCAAHGFFVLFMFHDLFSANWTAGGGDPFMRIASQFLAQTWVLWPLALLVLLHGFSFVMAALASGGFAQDKLMKQREGPVGRLALMHLTIIFGGWAVLAIGKPVAALVLLVLLKTAAEIYEAMREKRPEAQAVSVSTVAVRPVVKQRRKKGR